MNINQLILALLFVLYLDSAASQPVTVRFRIADRSTREAIVGVVVELCNRLDTTKCFFIQLQTLVEMLRFPMCHKTNTD